MTPEEYHNNIIQQPTDKDWLMPIVDAVIGEGMSVDNAATKLGLTKHYIARRLTAARKIMRVQLLLEDRPYVEQHAKYLIQSLPKEDRAALVETYAALNTIRKLKCGRKLADAFLFYIKGDNVNPFLPTLVRDNGRTTFTIFEQQFTVWRYRVRHTVYMDRQHPFY